MNIKLATFLLMVLLTVFEQNSNLHSLHYVILKGLIFNILTFLFRLELSLSLEKSDSKFSRN